MSQTVVTQTINASLERVFGVVSDIDQFSTAVPGIKSVVFLTEQHSGVGTRFKETRVTNGREEATELEVTQFKENDHIRIVADSHGTVWDTLFQVRANGDSTEITLTMDARPHKLLARIITPLIRGMVKKALVSDLNAVKIFCES